MRHISDKIAEFVFEELSAAEMLEAQTHLAGCPECRREAEAFQHTHALLRTSQDVEPPRRVMFEAEKPAFSWAWQWLSPAGAAIAASLLTAVLMRPDAPVPVTQPVQPVVVERPAASQPVDYDRIIGELRRTLATELEKRDATQSKEINLVRTQLAYLESLQGAIRRETMQNAMSIAQLAESSEGQD